MKKKFLKISIVSIMLILVCTTIANALSFTATMTPSSTTVAESTEFTIAIKVSNLDVGSNGINSLSGYLKYDTGVFEVISDSSIEGLNSWSPTFNSENGKITLTKTTFVKTEESVFQVTFKTKAGVSGKSGAISYTNIVASNSAQEISASDISTTITIGTVSSNTVANTPANNTVVVPQVIRPVNNTNNTSNTSAGGSTGNSNSTTNSSTNKVGNNTIKTYNTSVNSTSKENIPYTGTEDTVIYVMAVVVALSIIFYIKFQKINKELK